MKNLKSSRKTSPRVVSVARDEGQWRGNAVVGKGKKRARMLQDKTNVDVDQLKEKKRTKNKLANWWKEDNAPPQLSARVESSKLSFVPQEEGQEEQELPTEPHTFIHPCDTAKFKSQGHLFVSDYFLQILRVMVLDEEKSAKLYPSPNYFLGQSVIRPWMRIVLFAWMTEIHMKFKLKEVVLWAAFQICDRFLSESDITREKLQLVGCTSLWIASKYHETYPPLASDLIYFADKAFTKKCIIDMECCICKTLEYQFSIPNAFQFLERYTEVALDSIKDPHLKNRVKYLARYGMERFHMQVHALKYNPSLLAAGALFAALKLTSNPWTLSCESCSGYSEDQINPKVRPEGEQAIFVQIKSVILDFNSQSHQAVIFKYKKPERAGVSNLRRKEKSVAKVDKAK